MSHNLNFFSLRILSKHLAIFKMEFWVYIWQFRLFPLRSISLYLTIKKKVWIVRLSKLHFLFFYPVVETRFHRKYYVFLPQNIVETKFLLVVSETVNFKTTENTDMQYLHTELWLVLTRVFISMMNCDCFFLSCILYMLHLFWKGTKQKTNCIILVMIVATVHICRTTVTNLS